MDSRTNPPAYLDFELITAENLLQHLPEMAEALHLPHDYLTKMIDGSNLQQLNNDLEIIRTDSIAMARKSIAQRVTSMCDEPEMQLYIDHKDQVLQTLFAELEQYLAAKKQALIAQESAAIQSYLDKIKNPAEFYSGNYARKLTILKKNLILSLQRAAYHLPNYWPDVRNTPDLFNAVFLNIAHMSEQGNVTLDASAPTAFARMDLTTFQDKLTTVLATAHQHKNPMVARVITDFLQRFSDHRTAKLKNGDALFSIEYGQQYHFTFTPRAFDVQTLAIDHAQQARQLLSALDKNQDHTVSDYENDLGKLDIFQRIRNALTDSANSMTPFRNIITRVKSLTAALDQDITEVSNQVGQLQELITSEPNYHRSDIAQSLTALGFDQVIQQHLLQKLQAKQEKVHREFLKKNRLEFQRLHYSMLADQYKILQIELSQLLKDAATQMPPLDNHRKHLDDIEKRRKHLHASLNDLYQLVDKTDTEYKNVKSECKKIRTDFLAYAKTLPDSAKHEPAAQQLARIPRPKRSFWTQNADKKRVYMGLLIGLAVAVIAAAAVAATIFSLGGFAVLSGAAIAGILTGTAIASGAGGNALGEFIHDKIMERFNHQRDVYERQIYLSTTANTFKSLGHGGNFFDDVPPSAEELSLDSSSDEREEVIHDFSRPVIFEDYSAESAQHRLRPT